jgi:transcriptional regulator with XRE-family HTH domain
MAVGRRLVQLRTAHDVSLNKLHLETRMSPGYLTKLERDAFIPGPENLDRIVQALKVLGVTDADDLWREHEAVLEDRDRLQAIESCLKVVDDRSLRQQLLSDFIARLEQATPVGVG